MKAWGAAALGCLAGLILGVVVAGLSWAPRERALSERIRVLEEEERVARVAFARLEIAVKAPRATA
jgi:hypothetical protein